MSEYTIVEGDCLKYMLKIPAESIDLILTSPPYPGAMMWLRAGETLEEQINRLNLLMEGAIGLSERILKPHGYLVWNVADIPCSNMGFARNTVNSVQFARNVGLTWRGDVIWDKGVSYMPLPSFMRRPIIPNITYEHLLVFIKGDWLPREKEINIDKSEKRWAAQSIWRIGTASATEEKHIAPYPQELADRCVRLFSLPGDMVLDPFLGSGTTMLAARNFGRNCIGVELDPRYASLARNKCFGQTFLDRKCSYYYQKI